MKTQKIKNFLKKFLSTILLGFVLFGVLMPTTYAVQLFGEDIGYDIPFNIPPVIDKEGNSYLSVNPQSSGLSSLVCFNGDDEKCNSFIATITPIFLIDLKKFNEHVQYETKINYYLGGDLIQIFAENATGQLSKDFIYFYYRTNLGGKIPIAKIDKNESCGTKNSNVCVIAFHFYMYLITQKGAEGGYLSHIDMIKYSKPNDQFLYYKDERARNEKIGFFQSIKNFLANSPHYGKKILNFNNTYSIFNVGNLGYYYEIDKTIDNVNYFTFKKGKKSDYLSGFNSYYNKYKYVNIIGLSSTEGYYNLKSENFLIRDFLVGNEDSRLNGNLKEYFGARGIIAGIVNNQTGNVETDPNVYNSSDFNHNCESINVGCHIKNMTISLGKFIGNIWRGFADIVKGIFTWVWENMKTFLSPIYTPIFNFLKPLYIDIVKPVWQFFWSFFDPLWKFSTGKTDFNTLFHGDQNRICSLQTGYYVEHNAKWNEKPSEFFQMLFFLANPFLPPDNSQICTSLGMKQVKYGKNTLLDTTLFLIFFASGIWFSLFIIRPR